MSFSWPWALLSLLIIPISDLSAWYEESRRSGTKYVREIAASCGGNPLNAGPAADECRKRSPLPYLERARAVAIDINHGIRDGHSNGNPVPLSQSLIAFNLLASPQDRFTDQQIAYFTREAQVPTGLQNATTDPDYGGLRILFRRHSGNVRITVFDGAHEKNTEAAFRWLNQQSKSR